MIIKRRLLSLLPTFFTLIGFSQQARITIDASKVLNRIPSTLYGSCIEDVNHEVYGGLYGQRIYGESFEEPAPETGYKGWKMLKGEWRVGGDGIPRGAGPGFKLVRNMPVLKDGSIQAGLTFTDRGRNAGLLFRVTKEGHGVDNLDGYAVNVTRGRKRVVLGKYRHQWEELAGADLPFEVKDSIHLRVQFDGPRLRVFINGDPKTLIDYTDRRQPLLSGKVGLRSENAAVRFEKVTIGALTDHIVPASAPQVSASWDAVEKNATGAYRLDTVNAYTGRQSQVIQFEKGDGRVGITNSGLDHWGIAVRQGQRFNGSVFLRASGPGLTKPVIVALESVDGARAYATTMLTKPGAAWAKYSFSLTANATDSHARFSLYIQDGQVWVDQATLMPIGSDQFKGLPLRNDIGTMMVKEGLRFLRYGGTMVNAPAYRWKNMKGHPEDRPPYKGHWYPYSSNGFGIEEFVRFCEAAGFEAVFAINVEEKPEDVADMVEYLTGSAATAGGQERAAMGHPAPYKLHYIEIGNEEVIWDDKAEDYEHYTARFNLLYDAIHSKDPGIQLVCSAWWRPKSANMEKVFRAVDGRAAYWDLHTDADEADAGTAVDKNIQHMHDLFLQWDPAATMKCAVFEENGGLHNMQRALGHATTLNAIRRHGDFVLTSCPANALQPFRQNDNDWDQGQIFFTPAKVWGMPPFYAQQAASENHQPLRVESRTEGPLDVTATRSEDGRILVIHVVNTSAAPVRAVLDLHNFSGRQPELIAYTLAGELNAENTPERPAAVSTVKSALRAPGDTVEYSFPAHSYTVLRLQK